MEVSNAYTSIVNVNGELFVLIRQIANERTNDIVLNTTNFSGFMFLLKAIENALCSNKTEDATMTKTMTVCENETMQAPEQYMQSLLDEHYNPADPGMNMAEVKEKRGRKRKKNEVKEKTNVNVIDNIPPSLVD